MCVVVYFIDSLVSSKRTVNKNAFNGTDISVLFKAFETVFPGISRDKLIRVIQSFLQNDNRHHLLKKCANEAECHSSRQIQIKSRSS